MEPEEITGSLEIGAEKLNAGVSGLNTAIDKFSNVLSTLSGAGAGGDAGIGNMITSVGSMAEALEKFSSQNQQVKSMIGELNNQFAKVNTSTAKQKIEELGKTGAPAMQSIMSHFSKMMSFIESNSDKFQDILAGGGLVVGAKIAKEAFDEVDKATGLFTAEKNLRELQRAAMQMNTALEGVRSGSEVSFNAFNRNIRESMVLTNTSKQDIMNVKKALGEAFGVEQMDTPLRLSSAYDNFHGSLTATNAALLIGKAVGIDSSKIAQFMSEAVLELGEDADSAAAALGRIQQSAEKSGLGFEKTMGHIKSSTESLKMWGSTIGGVAPLFDMFSKSLRGTGREGLTPELLQKMTSGLAGMTTSTKALLGIQGGLSGRGGAMGGALEIEAALEDKTGAGMKKIMDSLTQTLTQFGGGRITTRAEAIKDPTMTNNFMVQRQLLMKLINVDEATATRTIDALAGIEQNGLDITSTAEQKFGELIGMGDKVAKETTDPMVTALTQIEAAELAGSQRIVEAVGALGGKLNIKEYLTGMMDSIKKTTITGQIDPAHFMRNLVSAEQARDRAKERVEELKMSKNVKEKDVLAAKINLSEAEKWLNEVKEEMKNIQPPEFTVPKNIDGPEAMLNMPPLPQTFGKEANNLMQRNSELINQLSNKVSEGRATPGEERMLNLMIKNSEDLKNAMPNLNEPRELDYNTDKIQNQFNSIEPFQQPGRDIGRWMESVRPNELINNEPIRNLNFPTPIAIGATNTIQQEKVKINQDNASAQTQINKTREERHVAIKVTMDGDYTIHLKPIVEKIMESRFKVE